jgi:dolichyl-phosphooligosaccharide-protein glycotransferase
MSKTIKEMVIEHKALLFTVVMIVAYITFADLGNNTSQAMTILSSDWLIFAGALTTVSVVLVMTKNMKKSTVLTVAVLFVVISLSLTFFVKPASAVASSAAPVLSPNWFEGLNWIKENTPECSTVVTYWDPGHFIRTIGKRTVVFDGGSQNHVFEIATDSTTDGTTVQDFDSGVTRVVTIEDGIRTTARIQDITATMLTSDESLALEILKDYRKPGCKDLYYIASSDLIGKSVWWTYFSTWAPNKKGTCPAVNNPKGDCYTYNILNLANAVPTQDAIIYTYPAGGGQAFVLRYNPDLDQVEPFISQNNNLLRVENAFYFTKDGRGALATSENAEVPGMVWVNPDKNSIIYMSPELQNSIFTRLFFFDGSGLENFELVNQWGGELKLFKVTFDE